ncbi:MAG: hypothetical protein JXQ23_03490 [Clostridia bacterium]|nr:hypothetical protein [Clostridia bacterium]
MRYLFDNEVVVAKSKEDQISVGWGPYQFPRIHRVQNTLYLEFHMHADSALSYGKENSKYVSYDFGDTWSETSLQGGVELDDHEVITPLVMPPVKLEEVSLPAPIHSVKIYGLERKIYDESVLPSALSKWFANRGQIGKLKQTELKISHKGFCRYQSEGVLPTNYFLRFYRDPENNLWALQQRFLTENPRNNHALFYKSIDNGHSFDLFSVIYYDEKYNDYDSSVDRVGFGEQSLTFTDENHAFSLLRTTDGYKISPLYISYSHDKAKTWSSPVIFDDLGVWPEVISLKNGAHIAGYGRPGLFIRGLYNNIWDEVRTEIVAPKEFQTDTCSYCSMAAISDDTFIIAYSDFRHACQDGKVVKAIMTKKIKVVI